jgi:RNA polymerase sigma-70 factor (ECF subfamily)
VLYAGHPDRGPGESDWVQLVRSVAAGDRLALNRLYARTHRVVFTLLVRLTSNARMAEDLMLDLYLDLWRGARPYHAAGGAVLAWILNETRARAIARLRLEQRKHRREARPDAALLAIDGPNYQDLLQAKEGARRLQVALLVLAPEERSAIERAYFSELSPGEIAARLDQPERLITARLRAGLHKLRHALSAGANASPASSDLNECDRAGLVCAHALGALPPAQAGGIEAHLAACASCRRELESLGPVVARFHFWPADMLRPPASVQERLAQRVAAEAGGVPAPIVLERQPEWRDVAPGISCKLLATDKIGHGVSMLVRLAPGGEYPPHTHAGVEELHLLSGELWIDDRKLHPGEYNRAEPGTSDKRVWSETGCACVLVTSAKDALGRP